MLEKLRVKSVVSVRMSTASDTFGFELLQKLHDSEIQKKEDVIILFIHWFLVKSGSRCIGNGNENISDNFRAFSSEKGSELLPKEWNAQAHYTLRYVKDKVLYVLCGIKSDGDLLLNFMKFENESISNIQFPIEETVSALHGSLETLMPSYEIVLCKVQKELINTINSQNTKEATTQTSTPIIRERSSNNDQDPLMEPPRLPHRLPEHDPRRIGAADLYPGGQGGGMIFDPFSNRQNRRLPSGLGVPGRLPPGAIPPGARFDPFGPPDPDPQRPHHRRPDDDHLPPPGFYGDMFL